MPFQATELLSLAMTDESPQTQTDPIKSLADEIFSDPEIQRMYRYSAPSLGTVAAELLTPDQADDIKAYQTALRDAKKSDVYAVAKGAVDPTDIGIGTPLGVGILRMYAQFELIERETRESREHGLDKERLRSRGAIATEVVKALLYIVGTLILTLLGVTVLGQPT